MGWGSRRQAGCGDPTHACLWRAERKHCHFSLHPCLLLDPCWLLDGCWQLLPTPTLPAT